MLVIFEGVDGSGKGFLLRAFREDTQFSHLEWDRGYLSRLVYAQYHQRPLYTNKRLRKEAVDEFRNFVKYMKPVIVYLYADPEVLEARIVNRGENPSHGPDPRVVAPMFERWLDELDFGDRVIRFDTTREPDLTKMVEAIVSRIKKLQKRRK